MLHAQLNVKRAEQKKRPLSLRQLAVATGVSQSVLLTLYHDRSKRIDYETIDRLLSYFNHHITVTTNDLLVWEAGANPHEEIQ